jgi:MoxR-like ATPase
VTAPHEPALEQLESGMRTQVGAVLIGSAGVGKTTLAREAADRFGPEFPRVDWVRATV